jgi:hypothetical protein
MAPDDVFPAPSLRMPPPPPAVEEHYQRKQVSTERDDDDASDGSDSSGESGDDEDATSSLSTAASLVQRVAENRRLESASWSWRARLLPRRKGTLRRVFTVWADVAVRTEACRCFLCALSHRNFQRRRLWSGDGRVCWRWDSGHRALSGEQTSLPRRGQASKGPLELVVSPFIGPVGPLVGAGVASLVHRLQRLTTDLSWSRLVWRGDDGSGAILPQMEALFLIRAVV